MSDDTPVAMSDLYDGYRFSATLQLRTPLAVLEHHDRHHPGPPSKLPRIGTEADGHWTPKVKSWAELSGFDIPELPESEVASLLGPIRPSEYVPFLIAFRRIVETDLSDEEKLNELRKLPEHSPRFTEYWARHCEAVDFPESFFWLDLAEVKGVGPKLARALYESGYRSIADFAAAEVEALVAIPGIGPASARRII